MVGFVSIFFISVVGTKIGGLAGMILDRETGYTIGPRDVTRLSEWLVELPANEELRSRIPKAAREITIARFDDMVISLAVERIYPNAKICDLSTSDELSARYRLSECAS